MSTLQAAFCRTFDGELSKAPTGPLEGRLRALAERVPRLLGRDSLAMNALLGTAELSAAKVEFDRVLLVDAEWYYIAQVLAESPETTLIAIAARTQNLAAVLAEVRARERAYAS